jgi:hypothetical protein
MLSFILTVGCQNEGAARRLVVEVGLVLRVAKFWSFRARCGSLGKTLRLAQISRAVEMTELPYMVSPICRKYILAGVLFTDQWMHGTDTTNHTCAPFVSHYDFRAVNSRKVRGASQRYASICHSFEAHGLYPL